MSSAEPLRIWAVSDGRAGIEAQALGLAEAVARLTPAQIEAKHIAWPDWMRRLPTRLVRATPDWLAKGRETLTPPWPDLWIANGRASVPLSIGVRRWSGGRTFTVQLQDPMRRTGRFDLVIPPNHDGRRGHNVFGITGTPHRITPDRLGDALKAFPDLETLSRPHVTALIGGRSRAFHLSPARAASLAADIAAAVTGVDGSLLLTFSRRTPPQAQAQMREALSGLPGVIWDGTGPNPYFAFLASADHILVTEDSANMPAEAGATGKPVHLLAMDGGQARKRRFHAELAERGVARPFDRRLESWTYPPLRETERAAMEVLRRMAGRGFLPPPLGGES